MHIFTKSQGVLGDNTNTLVNQALELEQPGQKQSTTLQQQTCCIRLRCFRRLCTSSRSLLWDGWQERRQSRFQQSRRVRLRKPDRGAHA